MIIGNIYINDTIGSEDGQTGIELQDVVMQVEAKKHCDTLHIYITSPGGDVHKGKAIAKYIASLPNAFTIADQLCGSIATEIHLAVPLERRKIIAGTEYFIHNPLIQGLSGNAAELRSAADFVEGYQKDMTLMYCKATGMDKPAIEGLMNGETSLTDVECETLGFVSEVLPRAELKAVAFIGKKEVINKNKIDMLTLKEELAKGFENLKAELGLKKKEAKVLAGMVVTDNGELLFASEGALPEVGEVANIGEELAPEGVYTDEVGNVVTVVAEGVVESVVVFVEEEETVEALKAQLAAQVEAHALELEEANVSFTAQMEALKTDIGSNFVPKAEKKVFAKTIVKQKLSFKEEVAARRAELAAKKKK